MRRSTGIPALFIPQKSSRLPVTAFQKGDPDHPGFKKGEPPPPRTPTRWKTMITAVLREKLSRLSGPAGAEERKTFAELLADRLVNCALKPNPDEDKTVIMAITEIIDRTEGKPKQQIDVKDVTEGISERPDTDLEFFIAHGYWPEEKIS